jgi:hypothetical protein
MRLTFLLCAALSCASVASSANTTTIKFPGGVSQAPSPDGRFAVLNIDQDREPNHILSLYDRKRGSNFSLFTYRRHVDVSWSQDSKFFFVNDYTESDLADCVVVDVDGQKQRKISAILRQEIIDFMKVFKGSHVYVTCATWHSNDDLVVSVAGYGDGSPKNAERRFVFNAHSGRWIRAKSTEKVRGEKVRGQKYVKSTGSE